MLFDELINLLKWKIPEVYILPFKEKHAKILFLSPKVTDLFSTNIIIIIIIIKMIVNDDKNKKLLRHCFTWYRAEACQACMPVEVVCEQRMRALVAHVRHRRC